MKPEDIDKATAKADADVITGVIIGVASMIMLLIPLLTHVSDAGAPLDVSAEQAPGGRVVSQEADSVLVTRNGAVIAGVRGPWKEGRTRATMHGKPWRVDFGVGLSDTAFAVFPMGDEDLYVGLTDPQGPFLGDSHYNEKIHDGGYQYVFHVFYEKERIEIQVGTLEIWTAQDGVRTLRFSTAGYSKMKRGK